MRQRFTMRWDVSALSEALLITSEDVSEYMTDGRRISFILERRLRLEHPGWKLAPSEGASYDLIDPDGGLWEVRSLTRGGVYFNPSNQVGAGRRFDEGGFREKLAGLSGFILGDITKFPDVDIYTVPVASVIDWWESGQLGRNAKVSRSAFLARLLPQLA